MNRCKGRGKGKRQALMASSKSKIIAEDASDLDKARKFIDMQHEELVKQQFEIVRLKETIKTLTSKKES